MWSKSKCRPATFNSGIMAFCCLLFPELLQKSLMCLACRPFSAGCVVVMMKQRLQHTYFVDMKPTHVKALWGLDSSLLCLRSLLLLMCTCGVSTHTHTHFTAMAYSAMGHCFRSAFLSSLNNSCSVWPRWNIIHQLAVSGSVLWFSFTKAVRHNPLHALSVKHYTLDYL